LRLVRPNRRQLERRGARARLGTGRGRQGELDGVLTGGGEGRERPESGRLWRSWWPAAHSLAAAHGLVRCGARCARGSSPPLYRGVGGRACPGHACQGWLMRRRPSGLSSRWARVGQELGRSGPAGWVGAGRASGSAR
jgi:hypothetical protein